MQSADDRRREYIEAVTRGEGFMPWQRDRDTSAEEQEFRARVEERKYVLLNSGRRREHPTLLTAGDFERIRRNVREADWAREWFEQRKSLADYVVEQGAGWIGEMIPALTPTASYSFVCPHCFGIKSSEGESEGQILGWDYRDPDSIHCRRCGQEYPSADYPETARLAMPRSGQTVTYYLNADERANPDNRTGELAYKWAGHPIHPSFSGIIRERKISFVTQCVEPLALMYHLTGEPEYAVAGARILLTFTDRFRSWLYHDYWDSVADCDPLYAAWHDQSLPMVWKRHLATLAYEKDSLDSAAMLQNYWGGGRVHPSTGGVTHVVSISSAFDLLHDATLADGSPVWTPEERTAVERDLILEWSMEAEPYLGGPGHADMINNKSPRIYSTFATVARVLSIPEFADVALRGYEGVRDESFGFDGFSHESPAYNYMYLGSLLSVPERLHGFQWPDGWEGRTGTVDLYRSDPKLYLMMRGMTDILRPDGRLPTLSDTREERDATALGARGILELAANRYPDSFLRDVQAIYRYRGARPTDYAAMYMRAEDFADLGAHEFAPPETFFPAWGTAFLRHGEGPDASMLVLSANSPGGHRHTDSLGVYWIAGGRTILGDQGYLSAAPIQRWIRDTASHNLVIVDDKRQLERNRRQGFRRMVTAPGASVVELEATAYDQCSEYRRLIALIKGPDGATIAVDIFRVQGGSKHVWRLFSEVAASTSEDRAIAFDGLNMPPEQPIPDYGPNAAPEYIYGIRDARTDEHPPESWRAVWSDADGAYRLHMHTQADRVEAGHGPGQETWEEPGRRVRYVDVVREGSDLASTFVAVHECALESEGLPVGNVEVLAVQPEAGNNSVVVRIESAWGSYLLFSDCDGEVEVDGVRFTGAFGLCRSDEETWQLSSGARVFSDDGTFDLGSEHTVWESAAKRESGRRIATETPPPQNLYDATDGVNAYVKVETGGVTTGLPLVSTDAHGIECGHFPVPEVMRVRVEAVRYREE